MVLVVMMVVVEWVNVVVMVVVVRLPGMDGAMAAVVAHLYIHSSYQTDPVGVVVLPVGTFPFVMAVVAAVVPRVAKPDSHRAAVVVDVVVAATCTPTAAAWVEETALRAEVLRTAVVERAVAVDRGDGSSRWAVVVPAWEHR